MTASGTTTTDSRAVPPSIAPLRLGHAYWSSQSASELEDLEEVIDVLVGTKELTVRDPTVPDAVLRAEKVLGAATRPIYTFVGCLHPKLGTIGLIITPDCLTDCLQGATRCDSGGLISGKGGFRHLDQSTVEGVLASLSFDAASGTWGQELNVEVDKSYGTRTKYIDGTLPDHSGWTDPRSMCISKSVGTSDLDRRLWTWEVRLSRAPKPNHFECLVVSAEAFKRIEALRLSKGQTPPDAVRILFGKATSVGVHHFEEEAVFKALAGVAS